MGKRFFFLDLEERHCFLDGFSSRMEWLRETILREKKDIRMWSKLKGLCEAMIDRYLSVSGPNL